MGLKQQQQQPMYHLGKYFYRLVTAGNYAVQFGTAANRLGQVILLIQIRCRYPYSNQYAGCGSAITGGISTTAIYKLAQGEIIYSRF